MEEATPDYAQPKVTAIAPTALIYERIRNPRQSTEYAGELGIRAVMCRGA
jgi:hypothetical protein